MSRDFWNESWARRRNQGGDVDWSRASRNVDRIVAMLGLREADRVLDVACGTGAEAVELASRGFSVTGLDFSSEALMIAAVLAEEREVIVNWVCADMRHLGPGSYDAILLRDVIFGCFPSDEDNGRVLDEVRDALRPGGRFLLEVYTKEFAVRHGIERKLVYSQEQDLFFCRDGGADGPVMRLCSRERLLEMLASRELHLIREETWSWADDPPGPPFRGWVLACVLESSTENRRAQ